MTLLTKVAGEREREWLCSRAAGEGWSRAALEANIESHLFDRQGQGVNNFEARMPAAEAATAREALKDPYPFDFLGVGEEAQERDHFYLAAMDAQMKAPDDRPTMGLLLVRRKNRMVAEYSLSGMEKPLGISDYQLPQALPGALDTNLPTIEALEEELSGELELHAAEEAG